MKNIFTKPFLLGALLVTGLGALTSVVPVSADLDAWSWTDRSGTLTRRDGIVFTTAAARQGEWLLSDGSTLLRINADTTTDLTQAARDRGARSIKLIASDSRSWMIWNKNPDDVRGQLWLTDGTVWTDLTNVLPPTVDTLEVNGSAGSWILRAQAHGTSRVISLAGVTAIPQDLALPIGTSSLPAGCVKQPSGSSVCTGVNRAVAVNGSWYWIGSASESRAANGTTPERVSMKLWRVNGTEFIPVKNVPAAKFVSGVWQTSEGLMVATSESPMQPLTADRLWVFNGISWRELSPQAKVLGLLPTDASKLKVAFGGTSWMLVAGNITYRYDGVSLQAKGHSLGRIHAIAGENGFVVAGSTPDGFATLSLVRDQIAEESAELATSNVTAVASLIAGTDLRVEGIPSDALIGEGRGFRFRATATDAVGIDRIEIFVNGARIRICESGACDFTQTYWALNQPERKVNFQAKAWNKLGQSTESRTITLVVKQNSTAGLAPSATVGTNVALSQDAGTGMAYATWIDPNVTALPAGDRVTYSVAGRDQTDGLASIELWVNGSVIKTCAGLGSKTEFRCDTTLFAAQYPTGTDLFMNAKVTDSLGNSLWTPATTLTRPAAAAIAADQTVAPVVTETVSVFGSRLMLEPASRDIRRGTTVTVRAKSTNSTTGLNRVEISYGGQIRRICSFGNAMSETTCDLTIDTSTLADNTSLSFVARAIDSEGRETWSNSESVTVRGASWSPTPSATTADSKGFSQWHWLTPEVAELENQQEATYTVGSWSPEGIRSIEMVANGITRKTCAFVNGAVARECAYTLRPSDWSHGEPVTVNARITDSSGNVIWSAHKTLLMTRGWWEAVNRPSAYVNVTADRSGTYRSGDRVTFTLMGWSPNGAERLELLVDGKVVASCPSDVCRWTSQPLTGDHLEFQSRLTDRAGKQVWSGLYGLKK